MDGLLPVILQTGHPPPMGRQKMQHLENHISLVSIRNGQINPVLEHRFFKMNCSVSESCPLCQVLNGDSLPGKGERFTDWPLTWGHCLPVFPGVTTVLSMTTLMIGSRTSLPNTNCFIKAIDVYLGICFSFVFGALLEYAVAHYSSLQQMAAKDRVRVLRALYVIHHLPYAGL